MDVITDRLPLRQELRENRRDLQRAEEQTSRIIDAVGGLPSAVLLSTNVLGRSELKIIELTEVDAKRFLLAIKTIGRAS